MATSRREVFRAGRKSGNFRNITYENMPYQPPPWSIVPSFSGGKQLPHALGLAPTELTLLRGDDTSDKMTNVRKYISLTIFRTPRPAWNFRPAALCVTVARGGYIAYLSTNTSANTPTPHLFAEVARLLYLREGESEFSFARARVPTYSPNCLTSADVPIQEGTPIFGILLPTFGTYAGATFATWEAGALASWMSEGVGPAVFISDVDLDPRSWATLPSLGASGFFTKKTTP